jgi:hypothetical protein
MFPTINATVIQKNAANAFICGPCGDYGKVLPIPCGTAAILGAQYWATPQKKPWFQGFRYTISDTAPTSDSFQVFKVTNSITGDYFYVMGTIEEYSAACGACCDTSPVPSLVVTDLPDMTSCQDTCTTDGTNYDAFFAVPDAVVLGAGKYVARVEVDGTLVWQQTFGGGSASIAALVTALNLNAGSAGTWSNPADETIRLRTTLKKEVCFVACVKTA